LILLSSVVPVSNIQSIGRSSIKTYPVSGRSTR